MRTVTYALVDSDTGTVVGIHVESAELESSSEEVSQIADIQGSRHLRIIILTKEDEALAGPLRVVDGELRASDGGGNWGSAEIEAVGETPEPEARRYTATPPSTLRGIRGA